MDYKGNKKTIVKHVKNLIDSEEEIKEIVA